MTWLALCCDYEIIFHILKNILYAFIARKQPNLSLAASIKIDKSFIDELDDRNEHPLIESILVIGRQVGLVVIAEGVETEKQHNRLIEMGGDGFQGYLFSRPLPEKEFVQWIISNDGLVLPRGESGITPGLL